MRTQPDISQRSFRTHPVFDRRQTASIAADLPCPDLDRDVLLRMSKHAIQHDFAWLSPAAAGGGGWEAASAHQRLPV